MFKPLLATVSLFPATPVLGDKGYKSASNSDYLCAHHLTDGIMHKKPKGKELSPALESCNRAISAGRYVIERTFGSIHSWMGGVVHVIAVLPRYIRRACWSLWLTT